MNPIYAGFWSIVPPIVAIVSALFLKEILVSLLIGIFSGALIFSVISHVELIYSLELVFESLIKNLSDTDNAAVIIFTSLLGVVSQIMTDSGGASGYTRWAQKKLKSSRSSQLSSVLLSFICSIDDTFLCLMVGNVMRDTMDKHKISRARFAYILDMLSSQLPVIMPVSSWAAAIVSCIGSSGLPGMHIFLKSILFNFYSIFSIVLVIFSSITGKNFNKITKFETESRKGNDISAEHSHEQRQSKKLEGSIWDLIIPIASLLIGTLFMILKTGGVFSGNVSYNQILENVNFNLSVSIGSLFAILVSIILFVPRKIKFSKFAQSIGKGIEGMTYINTMLVLAWGLTYVCNSCLSTGEYIKNVILSCNIPIYFIPFASFVLSTLLSFSIGSSWGTFGILIPIMSSSVTGLDEKIISITIAAILSGSICGVNCTPVSSMGILASSSARCKHLDHISSQIPYALLMFAISSLGFILAPFVNIVTLYVILIPSLIGSYFILTK